jgi:sporulation protein YtfJ
MEEFMEKRAEKINDLMQSNVANTGVLADVNTVIGKPITTASGLQIIPFTKVTVGNLSGGGEYGDVKVVKEINSVPFAGGSGSVVSMKPMGFLVDDGKSCRILRITDEPINDLIERVTEIVHDIVAKD